MTGIHRHRPAVVAFVLLLGTSSAKAQDTIDEILKKPGALSNQDRAMLEAEIPVRIRRVFGSGGSSAKPAEAKDRLVKPAKVKGVNPATLDIYAEIITSSLESKVTEDDYETALHTALVFEELESAATLNGLLAGLRSKHVGVRFVCVRALTALRTRLKTDSAALMKIISALGDLGENETDPHVLRRLYACLNVTAVAPDLNLDDAVATALNRVLASRVRQIRGGQVDTLRDEEAIATAQACYRGAKPPQQANLMSHLFTLLEVTAMRYADIDTAPESLPAIGRLSQKLERAIHDGIRDAKGAPPSRLVSDLLKPGVSDKQRLSQEVRGALDELRKVLRGDPWKIP